MNIIRKSNMGMNAILNVINSGLSILFPLITYPYVLRVLGTGGIGRVSYCASFINYFSLIAMLGIPVYGVCEGAKRKNNKTEFNRFVNEIFTINLCSMLLAYTLLCFFLVFSQQLHGYGKLMALQSISIIFVTLSVDWLNTIYEDFAFITLRNIVTHIISIILLFVFVKRPEDYYWYAWITVVSNGITCIINICYIRRYAKPALTFKPDFLTHFRPLILMFSNAVAISVYVNFDTTMLGWLKGDDVVGVYTIAVKIYITVKSMLSAVCAVAVPRLASYISEKEDEKFKNLYSDLWGCLSLLVIPAGTGLICIAREAVIIIGGREFIGAVRALQILSVSLVFAVYGGLVTSVLNITLRREKDNLQATLFSAVLNCGLNFVFIPLMNQNGAALTTLISEIFVLVFCLIKLPQKQKYINFETAGKSVFEACAGSVMIVAFTALVKYFTTGTLLRVGLIFTGSIIIYIIVLMILKNKYVLNCMSYIKK